MMLVRDIVLDNVCVRGWGNLLFVPAGHAVSMEKEIKDVITGVAKTHHYWTERLSY